MMPVTLSVITTVFPPEERGKAVGTWVGVAAGGARHRPARLRAPAASGFSWPSIFGLNVVLAARCARGTLADRPGDPRARPPRLDPIGTLVSVVALAALVFGIIEGRERGWGDRVRSPRSPPASPAIVAFVVWELRRRDPMLDPRNFLRRGFGAGSLSISVQFFAAVRLPLPRAAVPAARAWATRRSEASAALLPMALVVIPLSRVAPAIAARVGVRVDRRRRAWR